MARSVVVVAFHVPASDAEPTHVSRVGEGFLQTRWSRTDVLAPIERAGWRVAERCSISDPTDARDAVWLLRPASRRKALPSLQTPKVSIVMPTLRRPHTIFRTIASIRAQTYSNWELIVVDNAGDGDYWFDDARIHVHAEAARTGASYARNQGLRHVTGDLVCFFDDDDDMFPTYLERLLAAFEANPGASMVRCGMLVDDGSTNFTFATPECCLRREFATPTWAASGNRHDQLYFESIVARNGWSEAAGDIVVVPETLCRANSDARGGLRAGHL